MYVGPLVMRLVLLICLIVLLVRTAWKFRSCLASLTAVLSRGSGSGLLALDTVLRGGVLFVGVQLAERRAGGLARTGTQS
jgi:hypothetical protein